MLIISGYLNTRCYFRSIEVQWSAGAASACPPLEITDGTIEMIFVFVGTLNTVNDRLSAQCSINRPLY